MKNLKIKVCGMKYPYNMKELLNLHPDYMGFIFYAQSQRNFTGKLPEISFGKTKKTGVFVNADLDKVLDIARRYKLDVIQLHGSESPVFCNEIRSKGYEVIKAFAVDENFNFQRCSFYDEYVDLFLFDAKGKLPGGNGVVFNWEVLKNYYLKKPFLLSGGIGLKDLSAVLDFEHPALYGVDVNSGFEIEPGLKNINELRIFIEKIRSMD